MTYASLVLADSPQAYYRLGEASGITANDSSGHAYNGALSGTVTLGQVGAIVGDNDTAMLFDGASGYLTLPSGVTTGGSAFSVVLWLKLSNNTFASYPCVLGNDFPSATKHGMNIFLAPSADGSSGYFQLGFGSVYTQLTFGAGVLAASTWYQLAATYDGTTMKVYLNGAQVASTAASGSIAAAASQMSIARYPGATGYLPATLDEIALFSTNLTAAQITALYTTGITAPSTHSTITLNAPRGIITLEAS